MHCITMSYTLAIIMTSLDDNKTFKDTLTATPSAFVSLTTLRLGKPSYRNTNKKRKSDSTDPHSENIPIFKGQKKLNIQLTRSKSHTNYQYFESTKEPKSLALLRLLHSVLTKTALKFTNMFYEQITERTMRTTCSVQSRKF